MILHPHQPLLRCARRAYRLSVQPVVGAVLGQLDHRPVLQAAIHRQQETIQRLGAAFCVGLFRLLRQEMGGKRRRERPQQNRGDGD